MKLPEPFPSQWFRNNPLDKGAFYKVGDDYIYQKKVSNEAMRNELEEFLNET